MIQHETQQMTSEELKRELTVINLIFITKTVTCVAIRILRGLFSHLNTTTTNIIPVSMAKKKEEKQHLCKTRIYWCKEMEDTEKFVILWHHWKLYLYSSFSAKNVCECVCLRKHVAMSLPTWTAKTAPNDIKCYNKWVVSKLCVFFFFCCCFHGKNKYEQDIKWEEWVRLVTTVYTFLGNLKLKPLQ